MQDIKTKNRYRSPKTRNPVSRMPKKLIRANILDAKLKHSSFIKSTDSEKGQDTPTEYAEGKVASAEGWGISKAGRGVSAGGKKLAATSYRKIKERKREGEINQESEQEAEGLLDEAEDGVKENTVQPGAKEQGSKSNKTEVPDSNETGSRHSDLGQRKIKTKPEQDERMPVSAKRTVKENTKSVKSYLTPNEKMKAKDLSAVPRQNGQTWQAAKESAINTMRKAQDRVRNSRGIVRRTKAAFKSAVGSMKAIGTAIIAGGWGAVLFIIMIGSIGSMALSDSSQESESLSSEVLAYTATIRKYADEYGIPEFVPVIQAIMMQESGGRGDDPMQSSECPFNTEYPNVPNGISNAEYSIKVGIKYYAGCVEESGCGGLDDMDRLKLSLQAYNYGNGYISWVLHNYGGYSEENSRMFSQEQAAAHGWSGYGDPEYVPHVFRYYSGGGGNIFAGLFGNERIVTVAKEQLGNEGGEKFWSWYGYTKREEWCACFVSWCADKAGLIENGNAPLFSYCPDGIEWFKRQGRWKDVDYTPVAGNIIFFDWTDEHGGRDGISDHVGIVEKCENGIVYTIEGNSNDEVKQNYYSKENKSILGYGI